MNPPKVEVWKEYIKESKTIPLFLGQYKRPDGKIIRKWFRYPRTIVGWIAKQLIIEILIEKEVQNFQDWGIVKANVILILLTPGDPCILDTAKEYVRDYLEYKYNPVESHGEY